MNRETHEGNTLPAPVAAKAATYNLDYGVEINLRRKAHEFMKENADLSGTGYVYIFRMKACGWMCDLLDSHRYEPGVFAVPASGLGLIFKAIGGDPQNGATEWIPVNQSPPAVSAATCVTSRFIGSSAGPRRGA